ncbi:L-seryl-tRNA(Sec) selenium transferase [Actinocatenispora rupis]|uniref:L-seryl-tRNA(Sec) selenium transferase n=1 Tax=Actinocatenispora rupis TaxID=519421 RepID=UPI001EF24948
MDVRRRVPRTDTVLAEARVAAAADRLGRGLVKSVVTAVQQDCRAGRVAAEAVVGEVLARLPDRADTGTPVLNATGVLLHTNLGRAPLSEAARRSVAAAAGTGDVELDLATGRRGQRGAGTLAALLDRVPAAEAALVVNNNAAALVLAATALAAGREIVIGRGELVEIGDGFRLPDLLASTGARLREVGTTNRTVAADYAAAVGPDTGFVLKVHPSNFTVTGFTAAASVRELAGLGVPVVVDVGSGLLTPHPVLPDEPDVTSALAAGAALVTASGDKLLGGPQAGLVLGRADVAGTLRRHPLYRALRVDKLTLAALEATLRGPLPPVPAALAADPADRRRRADRLAARLRAAGVEATAVPSDAAVGGGGAPGVTLPSAAVRLPAGLAVPLRLGRPAVLARVADGYCLVDVAAVDEADDHRLYGAVRAAAGRPCG